MEELSAEAEGPLHVQGGICLALKSPEPPRIRTAPALALSHDDDTTLVLPVARFDLRPRSAGVTIAPLPV